MSHGKAGVRHHDALATWCKFFSARLVVRICMAVVAVWQEDGKDMHVLLSGDCKYGAFSYTKKRCTGTSLTKRLTDIAKCYKIVLFYCCNRAFEERTCHSQPSFYKCCHANSSPHRIPSWVLSVSCGILSNCMPCD